MGNRSGKTEGGRAAPRVVVVTGADETFAPRLKNFMAHLAPAVRSMGYEIACFDLGLSTDTVTALRPLSNAIIQPGWDLDVAAPLRTAEPHLRVLTIRPNLRRYLPGYDVYLWIDCDVHVQHPSTMHWFVDGALSAGMALVPQIHHAYVHGEEVIHWRAQRTDRYFGQESARRSVWRTYYNAGIFSLHAGAPHWEVWRACFAEGIAASRGELVCDQTALNEAIHRHSLDVMKLPAICNWLCHLALPLRDERSGRFIEPGPASREIAMLHMSAGTKAWPVFEELWR